MIQIDVQNILSIVNELKSTSGKNDKLHILQRESGNEDFKKFIKYTLDPLQVYGIQDKKLKKFLGKTAGTTGFDNLFDVFEYLKSNPTGRDTDVIHVAEFIDSEPDAELKELYVEALCKKLRMGIDKTVNKAYGSGFLNQFEVMLAKKFEDEAHKLKGEVFAITEKLDGQRAVAIIKDSDIKLFSRQGQALTGFVEIEEDLLKLPDGVYDGEFLIKNPERFKDRDVLQETLKISRKNEIKTGLDYHLFDMISNDDFQSGKSKETFINRKNDLIQLIEHRDLDHIKVLPNLYVGEDINEIHRLLKVMDDKGLEGVMVNRDLPYYTKRSDALLKVKTMLDFDEYCVDVIEGEGKHKGKLGAILLKYKGKYDLKCGSGFTDEQREYYWNNPNEIVGKIVTVQYFRESKNADGNLSVSFPIFVAVRDDKSEPSYH